MNVQAVVELEYIAQALAVLAGITHGQPCGHVILIFSRKLWTPKTGEANCQAS